MSKYELDIESMLEQLASETVPADIHNIAEENKKAFLEKISKTISPSPWKRIRLNGISKFGLAAAAITMIVVGITYIFHDLSIDGASIAWADVQKAFLAEKWVHLKYDNGREKWISLLEGKYCFKYEAGQSFKEDTERIVFIDRVLNLRQIYDPTWGSEVISEDRPALYKDNIIPPWEPKTAWEAVVGPFEKMIEKGEKKEYVEVEKHREILRSQNYIRFDIYHFDAIDQKLLIEQIWVDSKSRLPVKIRERLQLAEREAQNREFITGEFDFPESGPSSIYDLGVPRDSPIVKYCDKSPDPDIADIIKAGKSAMEQFPERYRAIIWENEGSHELDVKYKNHENVWQARYFSLEQDPYYHLAVPATAAEVLAWTQTQVAVDLFMVDGEKHYQKTTPHPAFPDADSQPTVRILRDKDLGVETKPEDHQWPYVNYPAERFELIEDIPDDLNNFTGLRLESGDIRREFYIDPGHDYICVRWIWWKLREGQWEKEREYFLSDFIQLPDGQWYASTDQLITYAEGISQGGAIWTIDVKVLQDDEFPADIFNGEKLLEGAKLETY